LLGFGVFVGNFPDRESYHCANGDWGFRFKKLTGYFSFIGFERPVQAGFALVGGRRCVSSGLHEKGSG
jgi:hypothetical protein